MTGGSAKSFIYDGGDGADSVQLATPVENHALVHLGDGDNGLTVRGEVGRLAVKGGDGTDTILIEATAAVRGSVAALLGYGDNSFTLDGSIDGYLEVAARDGADNVSIAESAAVGRNVKLELGDGNNTTSVAGTSTVRSTW